MWTWPVDPSCGVSFEDMGLWAQVGFVNLAQKPSLGWWIGLMTLAWALALAADSLLRACLPPCHVNVAACGPCPWARTLLKLLDLAASGPGLGLVRLADGPTMGLWTWLLVGLASLCGSNCGPSCYCYLWTCLAPAAVTSHCKQAAREIVDFHMWTRQSVNLACCQPTWQELEICLSCLLDGPARLPTCVPGCLRTLPSGTQQCGPTAWIQLLVGPPYGAELLAELACGPNPARSCANGRCHPSLGTHNLMESADPVCRPLQSSTWLVKHDASWAWLGL